MTEWGRLVTCGGLAIRLSKVDTGLSRPISNRPQVTNLPHVGGYFSNPISSASAAGASGAAPAGRSISTLSPGRWFIARMLP